uniref:double zinc ribbon and ankyrin repeat-containing protein 1 n=1 Tax=Ciona intestinalis TaxID=7719 RepID=UPI000180CF45|nr:double zinc ribbon and ankyrin repeat-containing protein 1 [Ciona intestinalis]|eukprot:XP_009860289.1 double zinc ribbon and ankyrin repeat-containing protein 1 [Ciona intestinalis]
MTAGSIAVPTVMPLRVPVAGRPKNSIDSNTLIEIRSDTPGTKIYYTVDNTRPEPDKKLGENTTWLYKEPFMLRHGKRYVKSVARTKDGRESNVVTKVFNVEFAEPNTDSDSESEGIDDANNFQREMEQNMKSSTQHMTASILRGDGPTHGTESWNADDTNSFNELKLGRTSGMRSSRLNTSLSVREEDMVRCVYCDASRPRNSSSRFCPECGKPVPVDPNSPIAEPGSMGMCTSCRSYVPLNQPKCIVCEAPVGPHQKPIVSVRLQDAIVCGSCGANNPPHLTHCTSCEHRFPLPIHAGDAAPPLPRLDGELVRCPTCTRVNNPDARFCDWCGEKPIPEQAPMTCSLCKSNNRPYSKFCAQCGSSFTPPNRMDPRNDDLGDQAVNFPFKTLPMWSSVPVPSLPRSPQSTRMLRAPKPPVREVQTQTVGLFYPGGKKVNQEQEMMREVRMQELKMRDKQPALTAVSPGRGFWRKQLDHICGHIRSYTNNNVEFRSVIGEPRLGKILGTAIDEGEEEIIMSVTFALRGHTEFGEGGNHGLQRDIYQSKKKVAFGSTFDNEDVENEKISKKKKKNKKKSLVREEKMNPEDRLLIKELGPRGEGRPDEVKQLIKEGADPNAIDSERRSALAVAVMKDRLGCVEALLKGGADVNRRSGPQHNSPLHFAVKLGPDGKDIVKLLLEYDAKTDVKNERGLSAYDLAVRSDYNSILALFNEPKEKKAKPKKRVNKKKAESSSDDSENDSDLF